jgi:gag-polyprotein putative aspartyl protease
MKVLIVIQMSNQRATRNALLDSGATESFIHPRIVYELQIPTKELHRPQIVHNIDGMNNRLGEVTKEVRMSIGHEDYKETHRLLVADIREDNIILGYPFFEAVNPLIDWPMGRICRTITMMEI